MPLTWLRGAAGNLQHADVTSDTPLPVSTRSNQRLVIADNAATDAVGVKATYTAPAGTTARVLSISFFNNSGTPTVQVQVVRGGATIVIRQEAVTFLDTTPIVLQAGDRLDINVTAAAALTSTADISISIDERI